MRSIWLLLIFFSVATRAAGQRFVPVFQVLFADKASLSNGTVLKSLDILQDEIIHVGDSGYLVLIHETGIPVEFSNDTTIVLNEIQSILSPPYKNILSSYQKSIGIDYLFFSQGVEARKYRLTRTGAIHDDRLLFTIYPPLINNRIYFDDHVKIIWRPNFSGIEIVVKIFNLFDDELKSYEVKDKLVLISKDELISEDADCIIVFTEKQQKIKKNDVREGLLLSRFYTDKISFPYSSEIKTPAAALMTGYFFEMAYWEDSKEAQSYYELATRLSDKKFYQEMLANYYRRQGK